MAGKLLRNYIDGKWVESESGERLDIENPSTGETLGQVPLSTGKEAAAAVAAARKAYPAWSAMPVARRVSFLFKTMNMIEADEKEISRTLVAEMGKSIPDAMAEMKRVFENMEVACGMPVLSQGDKQIGCAVGIDGEVLKLPIGVFAMIPPFNFPAMVPFWFLPYALATGNTYVVKPSEQVPMTMGMIMDLFHRAGFPPGVFNLVNGDKEVADALVNDQDVDGVSFVGSSRVASLVSKGCAELNKRSIALGSAKNHLVVMPDAKMDEVVRNMVTSCYGCAGQRCMASSAIVGVGDEAYERSVEMFVEASKKVTIADPLDPKVADDPMVLGPVISGAAKERILGLIETGIQEGATLALDGRDIVVPGCEKGHFIGPTVFTGVNPGMTIHSTEIFGPVVVMLKADTLDEAIKIINDHQYGNGASIYTQNGWYARKFKLETQAGMIGVNVGIPAPVASLPFGGMKNSIFGDIKGQGKAAIEFFTEDKIITERFWPEDD